MPSPEALRICEQKERSLFVPFVSSVKKWKEHEGEASEVSALTDVRARLAQPWGRRVDLRIACACGNRTW